MRSKSWTDFDRSLVMERRFNNNNQQMKKSIRLIFFTVLFLMGYSLFSCKNWGCKDCNDAFSPPTPWFVAARDGDIEAAERLLKEGADVDERDYNKQTALHVASANGRAEMVSFLIEKGANVNAKSKGRHTALHGAKTVEVAKILLDNGANINAKTDLGWTPHRMAISLHNTKVALFLINQGGSMRTKEDALVFAVWEKEKKVAKLLFKQGANPYVKDRDGDSAMDIAKSRNYQELIKLFETYNSSAKKN